MSKQKDLASNISLPLIDRLVPGVTNRYYRDFFSKFSIDHYQRYLTRLEESVGRGFRFSTTPYFLTQERFKRLVSITEAVLRLLQTPTYQQYVMKKPWFLPKHPIQSYDFYGDVEFHIDDYDAKIVEVNIGQPGHAGLMQILEGEFLAAFDLPYASPVNNCFEQALVETLTANYTYKKIAIAVGYVKRSLPYHPHYYYVQKVLRQHGVEAKVVDASKVQLSSQGYPIWNNESYDRIFNALIPYIWRDHQQLFAPYTLAYERHPELFISNPLVGKAGNKEFLAIASNLKNLSFDAEKYDIDTISEASLETYLLSNFSSAEQIIERFGDERNIVIKILENFHGAGVLVRPSISQINQMLDTNPHDYVVQRLYPPGTIPCISSDGSINSYLFSLRVGFVNGRFAGLRGYNFTLPTSQEDIVPVIVVP